MVLIVDPCTRYQELSRGKYRGGNCPYVANKGVCDNTLTKAWYRALGLNGSLEIQNIPAETATCGTLFPYWMQGYLDIFYNYFILTHL